MRTAAFFALGLFACGSDGGGNGDSVDAPGGGSADALVDAPNAKAIHTIFVIPFENKPSSAIYGNTTDAPYINGLLPNAAAAMMFGDELPSLPSEPHYIWMEAGTNVFPDHTFTTDNDASASNSTASTEHLTAQLNTAQLPWRAYQEGITTNTCPIASSGMYAAKHDPFVFFQDISGNPPSASAPECANHHQSYADFAGDLSSPSGMRGYVFITPDLCNDMHGALTCPSFLLDGPNIKAGDTWLKNELPRIIAYTEAHDDAVIFLTWDEGDSSNLVPFIAIGKYVKKGYTSTVAYTHGSIVKTVENLFGLPTLASVSSNNDLRDLFEPGVFQ
jgi:hypothetical protein